MARTVQTWCGAPRCSRERAGRRTSRGAVPHTASHARPCTAVMVGMWATQESADMTLILSELYLH